MLKLIVIGKIKESYLKLALKDYLTRINHYHKLEIIELPDINNGETDKIKSKEAELIQKQINEKDFIITLEIEGIQISSEKFADLIKDKIDQSINITIIIGGSYGLADNIKQRSNYHLSFGLMTFPHQLFRVVLLEQIYRAFKIIKNESYHK